MGAVKKQRKQSPSDVVQETLALKARVEELEETLRAIRMGEVDAVIGVQFPRGSGVLRCRAPSIRTDYWSRRSRRGAATLSDDGTVLYSNKSFAAFFWSATGEIHRGAVAELAFRK